MHAYFLAFASKSKYHGSVSHSPALSVVRGGLFTILTKRMALAWLQSKPIQTLTIFIPIRGLRVFSSL
jgi:hypothetical protein